MWNTLSGFLLLSRIHWLGFCRQFSLKLFSGGFLLRRPSWWSVEGGGGEESWAIVDSIYLLTFLPVIQEYLH